MRSARPTTRSTSTRWLSSTESKSGRSSSTRPSGPPGRWWRRGISSQSSSASPTSPQTAAVAVEVVGRRWPTRLRSSPASTLNSVDLPAPVGPASATTVASTPEPEPRAGPRDDRRGRVHRLVVEPPAGDRDGIGQRGEPVVEGAAHVCGSRSRRAASSASSVAGAGVTGSSTAAKRADSWSSSGRDPFQQPLARPRGERAHGLVAEHRLQHLLAERRGAAGDHDLGAREPARAGEHGDHHGEPGAVDAERGEPGGRALAGALGAHELEHLALPRAHLLARAGREVGRGGVEPRGGVEQRPARGRVAPGRGGALGGAVGGRDHDGVDAGLDRGAQLRLGGRPAGHDRAQAVAEAADVRLQAAHEIARPDDVVPAGEHFATQQRAAADRVVDVGERGRIGVVDGARAARPRPRPARPARRAPPRRGPGRSRARRRACAGRARPARRRRRRGRRARS